MLFRDTMIKLHTQLSDSINLLKVKSDSSNSTHRENKRCFRKESACSQDDCLREDTRLKHGPVLWCSVAFTVSISECFEQLEAMCRKGQLPRDFSKELHCSPFQP